MHVSVDGTTSHLLSSTTAYFDTGIPVSTTDPSGFMTTYNYDSTQTFTTSTTLPKPSSGVSLGTSATYDTASGALLSSTGMNGDKTTINQYDGLLRATSVTLPSGSQITTVYDTPNHWKATQTLSSSSNQFAQRESLSDSYGRVSRIGVYNGQSGNDWYQEDYCYDSTGLVSFVPTPYQGTGENVAIHCSGAGTSYAHDALGRSTSVVTPDGTTTIQYTNRAVETTDVNGIQKITQYDLLGRISNICEISASINNSTGAGQASGPNQNCGTDIAGSGYTTPFTWNLSGHSLNTNSGGQQRTFVTDAIGRTTSVTEPERGTTTYTYSYTASPTGLQIMRTRPAANQTNASTTTSTTTQYDALGRVVSISYSDGTRTRSFQYDQPASGWAEAGEQYNVKGRLALAVRSTSAGTAGTLYSYNVDGTVSANYECTPTSCGNANLDKSVLYSYDLGDNLTAESDGAGDNFSYGRSSAGEITGITNSFSDANDPATIVAANSVLNGPTGPLSYNLGNGLTAVNGYDSMGRNNGRWACSGSSSPGCSNGSTIYGNSVTYSGGQVKSLNDTVLGQQSNLAYDAFNRLSSFAPAQGSAVTIGGFSYVYDRWGNRWQQNVTSGSGPQPQYTFNTNTNQLTAASYDAAGNETYDGSNTYTYDADGNVTQVANGSTVTGTYIYDALNQRTRIQRSNIAWEFIFDQNGRRVSSWTTPGYAFANGIAYWDGKPVAFRSGGFMHFEHQDYLGTERLRTTSSGAVDSSFKSLPFGDSFNSSGGDADWYHFAGTDWDSESNTQHAQFRQYSSVQGRWMSPDPYNGSYDLTSPQSFNRYVYAMNNPLSSIDPSGLDEEDDPDPCNSTRSGSVIRPDCGSGGGGGGCPPDTCVTVTADPDPAPLPIDPCAVLGCNQPSPQSPQSPPQPTAQNKGPCTVTGASKIFSASYTFSLAGAGAAIGSLFGPGGTVIGAAIGNSVGVGVGASYVPATKSFYIGPAAAFSPFGGGGFNANYVNVPAGQNPNAIASGQSYSLTFQPLPFLGSTVVKSPGSAPVVGPSIGTRVPVSAGASYNFCIHNCGC